jgi:hypothetical protein
MLKTTFAAEEDVMGKGTAGSIKSQIIAALSHPEADDGLYFNNLRSVFEEEERPVVTGEELDVLDALRELIDQGDVITDDSGPEVVFFLNRHKRH